MAVMPVILICGVLALAGLLAVVFTVLSCVWLYRDSRLHGQPPALWVLLAVFAGPLIALLLYFIFGRKQLLEPCESCGAPLARADRFCPACGAANGQYGQPAPKGRLGKLGGAVIACGLASVLCMVLLLGGVFVYSWSSAGRSPVPAGAQAALPIESSMDVNSGWAIISTQGHRDGVWSFSMSKTSDGYHQSGRFVLDDSNSRILAVDVRCEGETLELDFIQNGETVRTETISGADSVQYFSLADLSPGEVKLRVVNHGATDITGLVWVM
ncbi:MAG TPA: zinc ribbon domain-containing protein [Candidatus Fournierella merdigallinarum]|nr:zinc ribbon domain-containing protein [Candidatus Fournierella merdigallinarum]